MNKNRMLRESLIKNKITRLVGAHDGLSAKIGEASGFDAIWASGFEISSSFCVPDANILSMNECLQVADIMNRAVNIPIVADCDQGFGDLNNVINLVRLYESRGIAGICIEDKRFPKINSFIEQRQDLVSIEEFSSKLMAAKESKRSEDFFIIARIEALIAGEGMDEAIKRATIYQSAGADALLIHSKLKTPDEIFEFSRRFKGNIPVFIVPTTYFEIKIDDISDLNINAVIYANHGIRSAVAAMKKTFESIICNKTTKFIEGEIASLQELFTLQNMEAHNFNHAYYTQKANELVKNQI